MNQIYLHLREICLVLNKALAIDKTGFTNNLCHLFYLKASICMEILSITEHSFQR